MDEQMDYDPIDNSKGLSTLVSETGYFQFTFYPETGYFVAENGNKIACFRFFPNTKYPVSGYKYLASETSVDRP